LQFETALKGRENYEGPACAIELKMAERTGIEIDYCPQCRGVWLDRGELDKIIERSAPLQAPPTYQEEKAQVLFGGTIRFLTRGEVSEHKANR
jgi:Zn-finger nucleic acid-binding protein